MGGFDNGTSKGGIFAQAQQFGSVLRGSGPPVPQSGLVGGLYLDTQSWFLYEKRSTDAGEDVDPWGHYLFQVPATYRNSLKWFSSSAPGDDIGIAGDYCLLWAGYSNYGLQPSMYGPKQASGWTENGNGPATQIDPTYAGFALPVGVSDEGTATAFSTSTQLIVTGLEDEYVLAMPVGISATSPVSEIGAAAMPVQIAVSLNPTYTAQDTHAV